MDSWQLDGQLAKEQLLSVQQQEPPSQQLQPQLLLLSSRSGSTSMLLRTSRSPSATRSTELMSRERESVESQSLGTTGVIDGTTAAAALGGTTATAAGSTISASVGGGGSGASTMTGSLGSGGVGVGVTSMATFRGFRSQSPSNRRSRERSRTHARTHGSDQGGLLAYGSLTGGGLVGNLTPIEVAVTEDSRLSGDDICYQSFISDELDNNPVGGSAGDCGSTNKKHGRHERVSSLQTLDRLTTKIQCTKESIRKEQTARDENVNEYLKLAASADKQQLQRIKAVFEKKNQKSAHNISQLQKKLDSYTKRVKDLQNQQYQNKTQHRQPREVLRDVGHGLRYVGGNIRDGISGFSGTVMSKPKEIAHLIKNKFGSADNINHMSETELNNLNAPANPDMLLSSAPNNALPSASTGSGGHGGGGGGGGTSGGKFNSENGSECSSVTSGSIPADSRKSHSVNHIDLNAILTELEERKAETKKLMDRIEHLENAQKDFNNLTATLEGERYRAESLEEQINDLTELHQNEIENLKQAIADMEEKVQYQSDERLQDVNEVLENCQTRISKMEHLSQQQYVTVEGIDNSNARALVVKLINVVLTILQVVLLLVATAAGIIMPFLKTRVRVLTTFLTIFLIICVIRQWPDVQDIGVGLVRHLKQSLVVK